MLMELCASLIFWCAIFLDPLYQNFWMQHIPSVQTDINSCEIQSPFPSKAAVILRVSSDLTLLSSFILCKQRLFMIGLVRTWVRE